MLSQLPIAVRARGADPIQIFESRLLPTLVHLREQSWVLAAVTTPEPPSTLFRASGPGELWAPIEIVGRRVLLLVRWTVGGPERDALVGFAADAARAIAAAVDAEQRAEKAGKRAARAERRWAQGHLEIEALRAEVDRTNARADELKRRLEDAEARASSFAPLAASSGMLAGIAHDVRSPLTSILCNLSAIEEEAATTSIGPILDDARLACQRIESVVASVRPITDQPGSPTLVDVHECVSAAMRLSRLTASRAGVQLRSQVDADLLAFTTSTDLCQVILHLLDNAIDASPRGATVRIEATRDGESCLVRVSDSGKGIPGSERPHIFAPFRSQKPGALGIGLAVARTLTRKHGGDVIALAPDPGLGGATLEVRLRTHPFSSAETNLAVAAPGGSTEH